MKKYILHVLLIFAFCAVFTYVVFGPKKYDYPIDLVYTWVDGNDPAWLEKKNYWQQKNNVSHPYSVGQHRYTDREELLHSLRSVELYMPWVRNIYIVTDNQIPAWLNLDHPKIKIIDHKDIFPLDALPVFNSIAIESRLALIPGLAEHFIYSNDDVFINKPLSPEFFFNQHGEPIFYSHISSDKKLTQNIVVKENPIARSLAFNPVKVFLQRIKLDLSKIPSAGGIHGMIAYRKSQLIEMLKFFNSDLQSTFYSKFRAETDVMIQGLYYYWRYKHNQMDLRDAQKNMQKFGCRDAGILVMNRIEMIEQNDPCMFCLNDAIGVSAELHTNYLRQRFPEKSSFEK